MKLILLNVSIFILSLTVRAQQKTPDYVITVKGDTIRCKINTPFLGSAVEYALSDGSLTPLEDTTYVREYYITKKKLLKRAVSSNNKNFIYLPVVENGPISLYELERYPNPRGGAVIDWYVGKDRKNISLLKSNSITSTARKEREDMLAGLLKDNQAAYNMYITKKKFTFDSLIDIVHFYNTGKLPDENKHKTDDTY